MNADKPPHSYRLRHHRQHTPPFWQADRPYLHEHNISDARFRRLGYIMAFLAGAINAGGFFAFSRYTSHVTGSMSLLADVFVSSRVGVWPFIATISVLCFCCRCRAFGLGDFMDAANAFPWQLLDFPCGWKQFIC